MPREIIITSPDPPHIDTLTTAVEHLDQHLTILHSPDQAVTQITDHDGRPVLTITINSARHVRVDNEPTRLLPGALPAPCWWTEAWDHDEPGDIGSQIARDLANRIGGRCHIPGDTA